MRKFLLSAALVASMMPAMAQRVTDKLDRGLIAQKTTSGVFLSWRIMGEEYYDVAYNVYRDGVKVNDAPLTVSNFTDAAGSTASKYTVAPVVRGKEKAQSKAVGVWNSSYKEIVPKHDASLKSTYVPNDACCCDVDGDGELEILLKYDNADEINQSFPKYGPSFNGVASKEHTLLECLKMDGTVLWWINTGPNMGDFQNNEINIVGYDWDGDGKAEVVLRAADGTTIHMANGEVYTVGDASKNYRGATGGGANWFMHDGAEYLLYLNGETGKPYQCLTYPLLRLEAGETDLNAAWGDGYGHRSSKYFFGAPYLNGRTPSIFLARGIYTRHKMKAFDVDPATHTLVERWRWYNNTNGPWKGQGYHNYAIADVDMDGRDEIVFGSMVIDDNGKGLSTTGYGHGDAQHCGDLNPYIHGLEQFCCNEDEQGFNYRDATTSKVYAAKLKVGSDIGRSIAGNFSDTYPGAQGCAIWGDPVISLVGNNNIDLTKNGLSQNMRIYWDGDLLEECFNYVNGKNTAGGVYKVGTGQIYTCTGSMTNNDTKGTPCYQGDVFGDWREEIIMRTANNNIRIYSTPTPTAYRNYTLWHDHQYRNAMVWQMCGYNQPPHVSYFLGELEGITVAPPPLTMTDRVEVKDGGTISSALNDQHVIVCEAANTNVSIENGASPYILTFNVPTWVQGSGASECTAKTPAIKYDTYTCNVTGGALTGEARLVKQGDGILNLPKVDMTHSGETNVWEGTLNFDGTMKNSPLWLNRFTTLNSDGGEFKSIKAQYDATISPAGKDKIGTITVDEELYLDYGSALAIDIVGKECDMIKAKSITTVKKTGDAWTKYGPQYIQPVIKVNGKDLEAGDYVIAECEILNGSLTNILVEGIEGFKTSLKHENGKLILTLGSTRGASTVFWTGSVNNKWNYVTTENFVLAGDETATPETFVNGDYVEFNDNAKVFSIDLTEPLAVDTMLFNNTKAYTIQGNGYISAGAYVKENTGTVTMATKNTYTGGNYLNGGTTVVSLLANDVAPAGNLGGVTTSAAKFVMTNGAVLQTSAAVTNGSPMKMDGEQGGVINNSADFIQQKTVSGTLLTKKGNGLLTMSTTNSTLQRLVVSGGTVRGVMPGKIVEMQSGTLNLDGGSSCGVNIPQGKAATVRFTDGRGSYSNALTGAGTVTVWHTTASGAANYAMRTQINGNWSAFEGTVKPTGQSGDGRFVFNNSNGLPKATLDIASGVIVKNTAKSFAIGALTGSGELGGVESLSQSGASGANTWNVGSDKDFKFDGIVSSNSIFNKVGSGTMTATGAWTTTGKVTVKAGTLKFTNKASFGTGALTVDAGAVFLGTVGTSGKLTNSSVTVNGTIQAGSTETATTTTSVLNFNNKDVTIGKDATLRLGLIMASKSETAMSGANIGDINKLTLNGTISLFFNKNYVPAEGDELRIFRKVATFEGNPLIICDGYDIEFDTSRLAEGVLVVKKVVVDAIEDVTVDSVNDGRQYNVNGQRVGNNAKGLIIVNGKKILKK